MKNQYKLLLTLTVLILASTACVFPRLVPKGTSTPKDLTPVSINEDLANFTEIDIEAAGPIFLVQGGTHNIQIDGPKSIVEDITFEVRNGVLVIKHSKNIWDWVTDNDYPTITITFENLTHFAFEGGSELVANDLHTDSLLVVVQGGASLDMLNLNVDSLEMDIQGGTDIDISGVAGIQTLKFAGGANYDAEDLKSASISLRIEGAVSATIWATDQLDLDLNGAYDVRYYGNPSLTQKIQGVGKVESLGEK